MGWGIQFKTDIFLSRISFNNKWELNDLIKEQESHIQNAKMEIAMMVSSTPKDIITDLEVENAITGLKFQLNDIFEYVEETYLLLSKLYQLQNYLEENPDIDIKTLNS